MLVHLPVKKIVTTMSVGGLKTANPFFRSLSSHKCTFFFIDNDFMESLKHLVIYEVVWRLPGALVNTRDNNRCALLWAHGISLGMFSDPSPTNTLDTRSEMLAMPVKSQFIYSIQDLSLRIINRGNTRYQLLYCGPKIQEIQRFLWNQNKKHYKLENTFLGKIFTDII